MPPPINTNDVLTNYGCNYRKERKTVLYINFWKIAFATASLLECT
jgi:hypothetical protein